MIKIDNDELAMPAWAAIKDINRRDEENFHLFSPSQIKKADRFERKVEEVWEFSPIYRNYRKNCIAIKVVHPINYKPNPQEITDLDAYATELGISVVKTNQAARIYRIPR